MWQRKTEILRPIWDCRTMNGRTFIKASGQKKRFGVDCRATLIGNPVFAFAIEALLQCEASTVEAPWEEWP
jgi:hypothetical protein